MTFEEILDQAIAMLQRRERVTYRALKRQFDLDDEFLEDLKEELIYGQQLAVDEDGKVLVWTGATSRASTPSAAVAAAGLAPQHTPLSYTPSYLTEKILDARPRLEGERKQVTVLFADIKDSTELIRELDPEAAQQLLDPAIRRMMGAVHRYEGTVNQVLGDGIMALFGAPIAHEDHALRACYASLAMQAAMREYTDEVRRSQGLELRIRVGLNSGEVVVRAIGNDLHMEYSAVGQTTHLAARMEQMAAPGSIRLSAGTLRLVEGLVRVNPLGPIPVKGLPEPVEVLELLGASAVQRRLQAAMARGLTRFVGRNTEIEALTQALMRAATGHGQVVSIVGEAGVGKSRLVYEFVHSHRTQGWRILEAASVSYGKATPYFPVVDLLKRYVHVEDGDEPRTVRAKVTGALLTLDEALQEDVPALLALLEALPADHAFLQLDPPRRRQRTLAALRRVLLRESQVQPLLLVFEDLHWIDAETQTLLDGLVESLPTAQILLLVNYRPEYPQAWGDKTCCTVLGLDPLLPTSADEFLQALLGADQGAYDQASLQPLKQLLIDRTEGNPFFLEESVRTLAETGVLVGNPGAYQLARPIDTLQVPATVQAVLAARVDRLLAEDKRLLQTAAVIGTVVPFPLLQAIADLPEAALHRGLGHLQAAEFLYETRLFPEHEYTFKHALTYEVAYGSLLQERRRILHARIMEALEGLAGDRLPEQVERLAHHALRGEVWDKALAYCRQAGEKAMARSAYREAVGYFEQALIPLQHLPETRESREQAIDLRLALRSALLPSADAARMLMYLRQAEALAVAIDDHRRLGHISGFLSVHFRNIGAYEESIQAARRALSLATASGDEVVGALANLYLGAALWAQGDYRQAIAALHQTLTSLRETQRRERLGQATLPSVQALAFLATCHAELGSFAEGSALGEEGLHIAETVAHPSSLMWASYGLGVLALRQGMLARATPLLERTMSICREADLALFVPRMAAALGTAYTLGGRMAEAVPLLTQAVHQTTAKDLAGFQALCHLVLAEAYVVGGQLEEAEAIGERALALAREHQERGNQAYALHLLGTIATQAEDPRVTMAATLFQQAIAMAEELAMEPLQAHCHCGLGLLHLKLDNRQPACSELSIAKSRYRAMDMSLWLPQVEVALAQLEGR